jgi:hypothetical protein
MKAFLLALALGGLAGPALAHVTLSVTHAPAGGYYFTTFRVMHGCAGSDTTAVRVEIPAGVMVAKPQPKAGWTIETERQPASGAAAGRVSAIIWRGDLPDDAFDEFGLMAKLPPEPGSLVFATTQTCRKGEERWDEVPGPANPHPAHPAPVLTVEPKGDDGMGGMNMGAMPGMDSPGH